MKNDKKNKVEKLQSISENPFTDIDKILKKPDDPDLIEAVHELRTIYVVPLGSEALINA